MKKYRMIKITVKNRETVSVLKNTTHETANEIPNSVCPLCHSPISAIMPAAESSAAVMKIEKPTAELPPKKVSDIQESNLQEPKIKGVL